MAARRKPGKALTKRLPRLLGRIARPCCVRPFMGGAASARSQTRPGIIWEMGVPRLCPPHPLPSWFQEVCGIWLSPHQMTVPLSGPKPLAESGRPCALAMCSGPGLWIHDWALPSLCLWGCLALRTCYRKWLEGWPSNQTGTGGELKLCVAPVPHTHIWRLFVQLGRWELGGGPCSGSVGAHKDLLPSQLAFLLASGCRLDVPGGSQDVV